MARCPCCNSKEANDLQQLSKVLGCPCRWKILQIIGKNKKNTQEIFQALREQGEKFSKQGLYYHLSELQKANLVKVAGYKEDKGGAPEKIWRLAEYKITVDLLNPAP